MEKYLSEETLSDAEIRRGLRSALAAGKCVPVFCGAVLQDSGLGPFLDFVSASAPAPGGEHMGHAGDREISRKLARTEPLSCFVFKTSIDQFSGRLSFVKIMSGRLGSDSEIMNYRSGNRERASKIYTCQGKKIEEAGDLVAGDLGLLLKLESVSTNDTLGDPASPIQYPPIVLPQPVHAVAISAVNKKDEDKLNQLINRACEEDLRSSWPTTRRRRRTSCPAWVSCSLRSSSIASERATRSRSRRSCRGSPTARRSPRAPEQSTSTRSRPAATASTPRSSWRSTRSSGASTLASSTRSSVAPSPRATSPASKRASSRAWTRESSPATLCVDIEAKIVDGKEHPVDSSEMAFKLAARGALRDSMEKASPVLLEPIMNLDGDRR